MNRDQRIASFLCGMATAALWIFIVDYDPARMPGDVNLSTSRAAATSTPAPEWNPVIRTTVDERSLAQGSVAAVGGCVAETQPVISLLSLLGALRQAESTGRDSAVGDGGAARGPYQIHRDYWREAVAGTDAAGWDYDTWVWDRDRAGYVVFLHWSKVCPTALRAGFVELLVRCHRLPYAPWRKDNDAYWRKVKKEIEFD